MTDTPRMLAQGVMLVSWWSPIVLFALFLGWAWVVATVYDKDAARFYLPRRRWNFIHIAFGVAALAAAIVLPLPSFVVLPVVAAILGADLAFYFFSRNADERVPEKMRWSLDLKKLQAARAASAKSRKQAGSSLVLKGPAGELPVPPKDAPEYEIRIAAEEIIKKLTDARGSQLDIAPLRDGAYGATAMVDGVRQPLEQAAMPAARAIAIMDLFKQAAGLDLQDRRRRLQADLKLGPSGAGSLVSARVTTFGSAAGMQLSLLLDPEGQVRRKLEDLGFHEPQLEEVRRLMEGRGVVLLAAPPDNGRTTTLYTFIRSHDAYTSNVQTVEMDPQMTIEGVRQNKFDPKVDGAEYSTTVRSILRRDPDVVGIAEAPDEATAKEVARVDFDRTRVYFSLPIDGAVNALQAFAKAVGDQSAAAKPLTGLIGERLVRRLCENCRVAFAPTPDIIKKLGLPADTKQLFRKGGQVLIKDKPAQCPICNGSGFFGQVGVFEVFPITAADREMIAQNDLTGLRASFRQRKLPNLQQAVLMHAIAGNTSVEEVARIMQPVAPPKADDKKDPAAPPQAPQPAAAGAKQPPAKPKA
ncbi:MAG: ATPase, T2SS/T4P/T4SS family [Planctomycetota bacterium]|nr:ATPase, T2SS/T4P/T4SS family [Planctomycetota bacterium]